MTFHANCLETVCMKFQIRFSTKNKKNIINLTSAEFAQRVVKVKVSVATSANNILIFLSPEIRLGITCKSSA